MVKVKLKDMTVADRNSYKYHKQVLLHLKLYGPRYMERQAIKEIERIEKEYTPLNIRVGRAN